MAVGCLDWLVAAWEVKGQSYELERLDVCGRHESASCRLAILKHDSFELFNAELILTSPAVSRADQVLTGLTSVIRHGTANRFSKTDWR